MVVHFSSPLCNANSYQTVPHYLKIFHLCVVNCIYSLNSVKGLRAFRGYFAPSPSPHNEPKKAAFDQFLIICLLGRYSKCNNLVNILLLPLLRLHDGYRIR